MRAGCCENHDRPLPLQVLAEHEALDVAQFAEFVDLCSSLLTDPNFKVSTQSGLHAKTDRMQPPHG